MQSGNQIRKKYLEFMASKGHAIIPSSPLLPENDPTTLFTSSGMQPLVPFLLGQPHTKGKLLANSQKCFRSQDIEEVGDNRHTTFFEMLGNWSLGDYFKKEQIGWFWEFLTQVVGLNPDRLYVTVFSGDNQTGVSRDEEAIQLWQQLIPGAKYVELDTEANGYDAGMQGGRIFGYGVKKNWWSRSGVPSAMPVGEPGGPDSEVFYDFGTPHDTNYGPHCHPNCDCGRFMEIGNSVFMQYQKQADGSLKELSQKNVDFGGGLSRIAAAASDDSDIFNSDLYKPIIKEIELFTNQTYVGNEFSMRVIADHLTAATFLIKDGVRPLNKGQGYFLRRLLRRAAVKLNQLNLSDEQAFIKSLISKITSIYIEAQTNYFATDDQTEIPNTIIEELSKFQKTLKTGLKQIGNISPFDLFQTYGFPPEVTEELYKQQGKDFDWTTFNSQLKAHQDASRTASAGMFKGGLENQSEVTTKYHTATHLIHKALRSILGTHVQQKGSNITAERLRFDFSHSDKITPEQIQLIEQEVNSAIAANLIVSRHEMSKSEALEKGALAFFADKYPDQVSVYIIGDADKPYSMELCGGPHVNSTSQIGSIKITKEEGISAGVRRIYAQIID